MINLISRLNEIEEREEFNKKCRMVDERAKKCHWTGDYKYNNGLRLVRKYGYRWVYAEDEVKYWKMCEGI